MYKSISTLIIAVIFASSVISQTQINDNVPFQTDASKDYSLVIPSSYIEGVPIAAFLALHPWNTDRWNAKTWCEELADFAEANNVILVCPDGGEDGKIDDPIDTAFTSFILDSTFLWYDIDPEKLYAIGFSWGGKTTYTYGLNNINKFAGLLPIGAAINVSEVSNISQNIDGKPIYIVHGSFDSPNTRFYPLVDAMEANGACLETNLIQGVGHTIDFDNQLEILTAAYDFLKDNSCATTSSTPITKLKEKILHHNTIKNGEPVVLNISKNEPWSIRSIDGKTVLKGDGQFIIFDLRPGYYLIQTQTKSQKFLIY